MANPEDAARQFLKGLGVRKRAPWDEPIGSGASKPAARKADPPKAESKPVDDIGDQIGRITERNKKFADRTKHLRKDY